MKSLKEFSNEIATAQPEKLVETLIEMTANYGEVCDSMIPIERAKMDFWLENKKLDSEKPVSDTTLNMLWMRDGDGQLERRMELYKKALDKMMSNVKAILREKEHEARNQKKSQKHKNKN